MSISPTNLRLSFSVLANGESALAVNATNYFNYADGKPSSDTPAGIRVDVVLPDNKFEKISVKLPGLNHPITPDNFQDSNVSYKVRFSPDFEGRFYRTPTGEYNLTCKASEIEIIK